MFVLKEKFSKIKFLRGFVLSLLSFFEKEIKIKHDITGRPFHLMLSAHKGYWFYGKRREKDEINILRTIIKSNFKILEIGGHIGYLTNFFESIQEKNKKNNNIKNNFRIAVAEPFPNSVYFLKKNIRSSSKIIEKAFYHTPNEKIEFYTENYGGFTNSIKKDFTEETVNKFINNQHRRKKGLNKIFVHTESIDNFSKINFFNPDFIKIDVEGAEYDVLIGAKETLKNVKCMMIEITRNKSEIFSLLKENEFCLFDSKLKEIKSFNLLEGNIFCINVDLHSELF